MTLSTALVADALGPGCAVMTPRPGALAPGMRAAGPAATIVYEPYEADEPGLFFEETCAFLDGVTAGSVAILVAAPPFAVWGELFTAAAIGHGLAGVVCTGATRDAARCRALGLPVFAAQHDPRNSRGRLRVAGVQERVTALGVTIAPGDVVVADDDGVVCVPAERLDEVLAVAAERGAREAGIVDELLAGAPLLGVATAHRAHWMTSSCPRSAGVVSCPTDQPIG